MPTENGTGGGRVHDERKPIRSRVTGSQRRPSVRHRWAAVGRCGPLWAAVGFDRRHGGGGRRAGGLHQPAGRAPRHSWWGFAQADVNAAAQEIRRAAVLLPDAAPLAGEMHAAAL